jgi:hypothetical protein
MSEPCSQANGPIRPASEGSVGSLAPRITRLIERRSRGSGGAARPFRLTLASPLGLRQLLLGGVERAADASPHFPPRDRAIVKAIACEAVCQTKLPLSRLSTSDLAHRTSMALGRSISPSTVWRIRVSDGLPNTRREGWEPRSNADPESSTFYFSPLFQTADRDGGIVWLLRM